MEDLPENNHPVNSDQDYYSKKSNKVKDIATGVLLGFLYLILMTSLSIWMFGSLKENMATILSVILVALYLLAIPVLFLKKKRYIAIGLILLVVVPLAIFGGCLFIINS
jgi:uncharacterized membrane protein